MTGVADGKVLERRMVKKNIRTTREGEDYDLKCRVQELYGIRIYRRYAIIPKIRRITALSMSIRTRWEYPMSLAEYRSC